MISFSREQSALGLVFAFLGGALLLFIIAPIAGIYWDSMGGSMIEAIRSEEVRDSIWLSLWISMAGTLLFSFLAIPLAAAADADRFVTVSSANRIRTVAT